jgi:hypothetical protein
MQTALPAAGPRVLDRTRRIARSGSYRLAASVILVITASALDVFNILDRRNTAILASGSAIRYLVLLIPFGAALWIRAARPSFLIRRPCLGDALVFAMWIYGVAGTTFGSVFLGTTDTARPVFLPMTVALLFLLAVDHPTDAETARIFRLLAAVSTLYVTMNFLVNTRLLPGLAEYRQYRNASFAFVCTAIACAVAGRRYLRLAAILTMLVGIFWTYPSATSVLMLLATALTLFITSPRATIMRTIVVATSLTSIGAVAVANLDAGVEITDEYFDTVQKANANAGRLDLWSQGLEKFSESPVWGRAWTDQVVAVRERDNKALPYHNDFILFIAEGGTVGFALLFTWIVWLELTLLRRYFGYVRFGMASEAMLTRVILVTLNGFFTAMGFNPVLPGLTRSIAVFGLAGVALSLRPPAPRRPPEPDTVSPPEPERSSSPQLALAR